ncbi:MAG: hypothetical protein K0R50_3811 [Eubacterium sp.]|jgi:hypothetical protein|nr:hypothetical protein [Eubacterium sp.]
MSNIKYINFNDSFKLVRGKIISKEYVDTHKGTYPVYSTQLDAPFGYIDSYMYDGDYLIWNTDGLGGFIRHVSGKFSITNIVGILIPLNDEILTVDNEFLRWYLQPLFRRCRKGREAELGKNEYTKVNSTMIERLNIQIPIPINENDDFDLEQQNKITNIYKQIDFKKIKLLEKKKQLEETVVLLLSYNDCQFKHVKVTKLFSPHNGNSIYTKEYCKSHKGTIPLYSGNTESTFDMIDIYDYDGEYLTWAKDGLAGYMMLHHGKFSLTGHRGILLPTANCQNINLSYMKFVLEPIFRANKKGREGDLGKNEYTTLNSDMIKKMKDTIPIPVKEDGSFDLDKQNELALKYEQIEKIKKWLSERIAELTEIIVS